MPQPTLRITETAESTPGKYQIEVRFEGAGRTLLAPAVPLTFELTPQDREDLRWYLEDFLQFPLHPAPEIAARIEKRMAEIGDTLCEAIFSGRDAGRIWDRVRDDLANTRVEIITDVRHAASIPWELIRDPETKVPLALEAEAFVRGLRMPTKIPHTALEASGGRIRILLVICRPRAGKDVPFRSVASKLLKGLDEASREIVQLDVLRPPTFDQLSRVLRDAKKRGEPYHVVHFDGHGAYVDEPEKNAAAVLDGLTAHVFEDKRRGAHGYLVFEASEEAAKERGQLVNGHALGKLLVETHVPVLVLNACRSAHADPPPEPEKAGAGATDAHEDIESFGSLALEIMDKGVRGVVAMRYNVYVATAAQFVADLYAALANGLALGEAVTRGRKQLHDQPLRTIAYDPLKLQDWCVPVVYEAESLPLFPAPVSTRELKLSSGSKKRGEEKRGLIDVPAEPDVGFVGRDETLLALDRAFDKHEVVLLHAYAGSGKSCTAAEFARWYERTGGVKGVVLWTSFERRILLSQVLDVLGRVFGPVLEKDGIQWLSLSDAERREVALQVLAQIPVLWIWDNVEPVAGFPAGTASAWSAEEQKELLDFLRAARGTKAKFLLTSRRDEQGWLGELPRRIEIPPMPMLERVKLARALAEKRGARLDAVKDWRPLLSLTQGNPLAITVLVGQALRDGLRTKEQVEAFVAKLRAGEKAFEDEASEGRSRSLGASLGYGFEHAFSEEERKRLALLHLFHGFVDVQVLTAMGHPEALGCLPEVRELTREAGIALLDRAAEIGLLDGHGGGYYSIHPAVPWFFRGMFELYYPAMRASGEGSDATSAMRAYVEVMGGLGDFYHNRYGEGRRDHLAVLGAEEPNLLHARHLARRHGWWGAVTSAMQGLRILYDYAGRWAEWARLVEEVKGDFVDPKTDGPLPGREEQWGLVNEYRVRLAFEARQWAEAERLQRADVRWERERAAEVLVLPAEALDAAQRHQIRTLAVSIQMLGHIQRECGEAACVQSFEEALGLSERISDKPGQAIASFNLGHAYKDVSAVRDLAKAELWYKQSLDLHEEDFRHGRAKCLSQLGFVALERFKEAQDAQRPETELLDQLNKALRNYLQALDLTPPGAIGDLAVGHAQIGNIYGSAGDINRALPHYQTSIRYQEQQGNLYGAAQTRFNVAVDLANAGRLIDARSYAVAALGNYKTFGDRAAVKIEKTQNLLAKIERALNSGQSQ